MTSLLKDTGCKPQAHGESQPGGGPCPRCDRPRCVAAAKTRPGERCRKNPHPGATICTNHGLTAAGRAKAEEKQLEDRAGKELAKLWVGLDQAVPVKDPISSLERLAGALETAVDVVGGRVNDLGNLAGGTGLTQLRGEVVLLERLLGQLRQALDAMARLDLGARQIELQQGQAQIVIAAVQLVLEVLHREVPGGLSPTLRSLAIQTFLGGIGRGPEVLEAEGAE